MADERVIRRTGFHQFREDFAETWSALPCKGLFLILLGVWIAFFHFLGNSTLGYKNTPSLFGWLDYVVAQGKDDEHGPWMMVAVLVLLWWKRHELLNLPKRNWWPALAFLLGAVLTHALGYMVQQARISVVGFFFGIYALIGVVWGPRMMRATFFPVVLFSFCFPMGGTVADSATLPLRIIATRITTGVCHGLLGINVLQNGTQLFDSNHSYSYEVAAACSGIRSLTATLALALIYAFVMLRSPLHRIVMIAATIPLAIAANVFRLTSIIIVSETFGQGAGNYVHESWWTSLMPYVPMIGGILLLGYWLRKGQPSQRRPQAADAGWTNREIGMVLAASVALFFVRDSVPALKAWTGNHQYTSTFIAVLAVLSGVVVWSGFGRSASSPGEFSPASSAPSGWSMGTGIATLLLLAISAIGLQYRHNHQKLGQPGVRVVEVPIYDPQGKLAATNSVDLPEIATGFKSEAMPISRTVLDWLPRDTTYSQRLYKGGDGFESQMNVVLMGTDRTSIHQPKYCLEGQGWQIERTEIETIPINQPRMYQLPVNKVTVTREFPGRSGAPTRISGVYVYWFVAEHKITAQHGQRMLDMGLEMLRTGVLQRWAYVSCFSMCLPGQEQATYDRIKALIAATVPKFQTAVGPETTLARNP